MSAFCILAAFLLGLPDGKKGRIIGRKEGRKEGRKVERKESGSVTLRQTNINIINNVASQLLTYPNDGDTDINQKSIAQ